MEPFCSRKKIIKKNGQEAKICDDVRSYLMETLQGIQKKEGYVSDEKMQEVADQFGLHPVEVYSVVSFYSFLSTVPLGKHVIRISNCLPCILKGSKNIVKGFEEKLGIVCGQTTSDGQFTLQQSSCIGMCDKAPAIMVDDKLVGPVKQEDIGKILSELE